MSLTVSTAPTWEPIGLDEAKHFARVDLPDDDALISGLIQAARIKAETCTGLTIPATTYAWRLERFECELILPKPPVSSVSSITYLDADGTSQTLSASLYQTDVYSQPARIKPAYGQTWPTTRYGVYNAVTVTYVAGYASRAAVPDSLKLAMLELVSHWYQHRDAEQDVPPGIKRVLDLDWVGMYLYPAI